jgi:membrane-bound serine protease (ClpP class)
VKLLVFLSLIFFSFQHLANELEKAEIHKIAKLKISGSINPATANYLKTGLERGKKEKIDLIVLQMNTPGGLVTTTKDILTMFGESEIPVVVWIGPSGSSATSAGAIIASGAHLLYMSEGTNIGAATPVQMSGNIGGEDKKGEKKDKKGELIKIEQNNNDLRAKAINDLVALVKSLSEAHNRNPEPFAEMISKAKSYTAREASEKKLINGLAATLDDLQTQINGKQIYIRGENKILDVKASVSWIDFPMDLGQRILDIFSNPSMAYILFLLGAALIYLEFQAPGGIIAGALGAVCLLMAGIGFQVLPLNLGALALIVLSLVLFVIEIYVTSYGILSIAGLATLVAGSLFLFRTDDAYLHFSNTVVFSAVAAVASFIGIIAWLFLKDLKKSNHAKFNDVEGEKATVLKVNQKYKNELWQYKVKVAGEVWKAESENEYKENDHVTVLQQNHDNLILKI